MEIKNKDFIEECWQRLADRAVGEPGVLCCGLVTNEYIRIWDDQDTGVYRIIDAFTAVADVLVSGKQFASSELSAIWAGLVGLEV